MPPECLKNARFSACSFIKTCNTLYKGMRPKNRKQAEGKTTLLGVGWCFPHCRWTETSARLVSEEKHPKDLMILRVSGKVQSLAVSAVVATAVVMAPATVVTVVTAIVPVIVLPLITRLDVNHARRAIDHRRRAVNDGRRTISHGRRINRRCDYNLRGITNRSGNRDAHGPTRLRRGGEPSDCEDRNQTEETFCFHERFDGGFNGVFSGRNRRDVFQFEAVTAKGRENE